MKLMYDSWEQYLSLDTKYETKCYTFYNKGKGIDT
jgi:hypothetical protein